jgi:predicted metalloprotease with PDZ domain
VGPHRNPASPGPLTLAYPEWIPGEHAPTGPLNQVVSLKFSANGKPLPWRRDDLHMFEFHLNVPPGANRVEADLEFACLIGAEGFTAMVCSSQNQVVVDWHELLLYSPALPNDRNPFKATLRLPAGWRYGTALPVDREENGKISFNTVPLKTLVDSPVIAGQHFRVVPLSGARGAELDMSA